MAKYGVLGLIGAIFIAWCQHVRADDLWITSGLVTRHLTHNAPYYREHGSYRENNYGLGIEYGPWAAGVYRNSMDEVSRYAAYRWMPVRTSQIALGAAAGLVDGYSVRNGGFFPVVAPMASWEGKRVGANLIFLPRIRNDMDAAVAIQVKVRMK